MLYNEANLSSDLVPVLSSFMGSTSLEVFRRERFTMRVEVQRFLVEARECHPRAQRVRDVGPASASDLAEQGEHTGTAGFAGFEASPGRDVAVVVALACVAVVLCGPV